MGADSPWHAVVGGRCGRHAQPSVSLALLLATVLGGIASGAGSTEPDGGAQYNDAGIEALGWDSSPRASGDSVAPGSDLHSKYEAGLLESEHESDDFSEPSAEENSHLLGFSRQILSVKILEPADGEIIWTEDLGASFDVVVEIHGGAFNHWDRAARIDADAFVELNGDEIWHGDGSLASAELSIWHARVTIELADDGTIVKRFRPPHIIAARLVDGTDELARVANTFEIARSAGGEGWAKAGAYTSPWHARGRAGLRYLNSVALTFAREIEKLEACVDEQRGMPSMLLMDLLKILDICI
jgi:hypothetical protein